MRGWTPPNRKPDQAHTISQEPAQEHTHDSLKAELESVKEKLTQLEEKIRETEQEMTETT
jgi:seryl-tRNA synthetase